MAAQTKKRVEDYIMPLNMNGLQGRMLHMPAPKAHPDNEILYIYGHHASLERWWGLAQVLNRYAAVSMPDLPGFGGMDSLYKIGKKPTVDNLADYLASFVKWRYKRKKVVIVALSFGFVVVTRMLQRYPELTKKVDFLVSAVGFTHHEDFTFSKTRKTIYRWAPTLFTTRPTAAFFRYTALNSWVLRTFYSHTFNAKKKFENVDPEMAKQLMDMEVILWHINDVRTHMFTYTEMFTVDNCQKQVDLPVWHVSAVADQYFRGPVVEQHLRVIFSDYNEAKNKALRHAPSVLATAKESEILLPAKVRRAFLARQR